MDSFLPSAMQQYTWIHGHPTYIKSVSDQIASYNGWVQMRFHCSSFQDLLKRISIDSHIICDCSLFVQLVVLSRKAVDNNKSQDKKTFLLGTGLYAMKNLAKDQSVRVLALTKDIYDRVKHVNPDSAQYLIQDDTNGRYLGLAQTPKYMSLADWQQHLEISFINNALQETDESLRCYQLQLETAGLLEWNFVSINC